MRHLIKYFVPLMFISLVTFSMKAEDSASNSFVMKSKTIMLCGEYENSEYVIFLTNFDDKSMSMYVISDDDEVIYSMRLICEDECYDTFQAIGIDNNTSEEYDVRIEIDKEDVFVLIGERNPYDLKFAFNTNVKNPSHGILANEFSLGFLIGIPEPYKTATIKQFKNKLKKYFPKL